MRNEKTTGKMENAELLREQEPAKRHGESPLKKGLSVAKNAAIAVVLTTVLAANAGIGKAEAKSVTSNQKSVTAAKYETIANEQHAYLRLLDAHVVIPSINLMSDLGIGDATPSGATTKPACNGWHGTAIYNFAGAGFTTPYLTTETQMDNWNYVLYGTARKEGGVARPITPEVQAMTAAQCAAIKAGNYSIATPTPTTTPPPTPTPTQTPTMTPMLGVSPQYYISSEGSHDMMTVAGAALDSSKGSVAITLLGPGLDAVWNFPINSDGTFSFVQPYNLGGGNYTFNIAYPDGTLVGRLGFVVAGQEWSNPATAVATTPTLAPATAQATMPTAPAPTLTPATLTMSTAVNFGIGAAPYNEASYNINENFPAGQPTLEIQIATDPDFNNIISSMSPIIDNVYWNGGSPSMNAGGKVFTDHEYLNLGPIFGPLFSDGAVTNDSRIYFRLVDKTNWLASPATEIQASSFNPAVPSLPNPAAVATPTLTPTQIPAINLMDNLGIGDAIPSGAQTRAASSGWAGPAIYNFAGAGFTTPYLTSETQMDNWNYVLYGTAREEGSTTRPVTPEILALTPEQCAAIKSNNPVQMIQIASPASNGSTIQITQNSGTIELKIMSPTTEAIVIRMGSSAIQPSGTQALTPSETAEVVTQITKGVFIVGKVIDGITSLAQLNKAEYSGLINFLDKINAGLSAVTENPDILGKMVKVGNDVIGVSTTVISPWDIWIPTMPLWQTCISGFQCIQPNPTTTLMIAP